MIVKNLGIIIPAYNEEQRFPQEEIETFLKDTVTYAPEDYMLIFVNDGSSDNTQQILEKLRAAYPSQVDLIHLENNRGKAEAVREAFMKKKEEHLLLGYLDCDMATTLEEFYAMGKDALVQGKKIYFGSRIKKLGSHIERKPKRHYLGRLFATFAGMILQTPIYDTQCGAKYFHQELVPLVFQHKFISKWLFDIELIARILVEKGYTYFEENAFEAPLNKWLEKGGSKIKLKDIFKFPLELIRINNTYRSKLKYSKQNNP